MKRSFLILMVLCSIGSVSTKAQDKVFTFEEAVKIALEKNVNLNTQKNNLYTAEARRLQGFAAYLPTIRLNANGQRSNGLIIDPTTGVGSVVTADQFTGSINANYTIFNGLNRVNFLKQANENLLAQGFLIKRTGQDVMFNVASQYLLVILDEELLRIATENGNLLQVTLDQIKESVKLGLRAEAEMYTQDALLQNQQVVALRAKIALENDRATLAQTMQLDPSIEFKLARPNWEADLGYFEHLSLDSLYSIALENRSDLKNQEHIAKGWKYSMRAATSGYYPNFSLYSGYGSTWFSSDAYKKTGGDPPSSFHDQFVKVNPQLAYGGQINIPIFDGLITRTNRVVSKVNYKNAELTKDNLLKTVKIDVQRSYKNYKTAIESYKASLIQIQAGELALKVQQESYQLGVSNQVALSTANQAYVQAASSKAQAEVTLLFQKILLDYALGTLKIEDLQ